MLVSTHNLPQTAPGTIADYRASEPTRGNETDSTEPGIIDRNCAER
jgi:hypothetical protein